MEFEQAVRNFDKVQKEQQGSISLKDTFLFPGGTIVSSVQLVQKMDQEDGYQNHQIHLEFLQICLNQVLVLNLFQCFGMK